MSSLLRRCGCVDLAAAWACARPRPWASAACGGRRRACLRRPPAAAAGCRWCRCRRRARRPVPSPEAKRTSSSFSARCGGRAPRSGPGSAPAPAAARARASARCSSASSRQRLDGLDADLLLRARQQRQQQVRRARRRRACRWRARRPAATWPAPVCSISIRRGRALLAADLGQRVDGALADPPVLVPRGLDQLVDGALVLGLVEDLDGGAADVLVLVARPAPAPRR